MLSSTNEAEEVATEWLKEHYPQRIGKIRFRTVMLEGEAWTIKAEFELRKGIMDSIQQFISMSIDSLSGKVMGYREGTEQS